jgi:predicted kinase
MLIILGGLPGAGKTTIARELARQLRAVHVRIDSIEGAVRQGGVTVLNDIGYRVGYQVAEDNLKLGHSVIADSVNPLAITRNAWVQVAKHSGAQSVEIEIRCSDSREHDGASSRAHRMFPASARRRGRRLWSTSTSRGIAPASRSIRQSAPWFSPSLRRWRRFLPPDARMAFPRPG